MNRVADACALLPEAEPAILERQAPHAARPLANRWIGLPALTTLKAFDEATGPCRCAAPSAADRDFFPPVMPPVTEAEVAWRLHRATAHPYLAAQFATAAFTAVSITSSPPHRYAIWVRTARPSPCTTVGCAGAA